ncbi:MAG: family 2 glycosyl transferase [Acidimicrobiaceae bacterium]|nr:family 2 glycosyl transferase [Acidimicrobiaceae bacterium]
MAEMRLSRDFAAAATSYTDRDLLDAGIGPPQHRVPLETGNKTTGEGNGPGIDLEIVVPAFNEQERIGPTLLALVEQVRSMSLSAVVRVIDNGSSDRTAEVVDRVIEMVGPDRLVITGCSSKGKGNAVARGVLLSDARWVGFCDADLATPASALDDAVGYLKQGWPVVVGSRRCAGANLREAQPFIRKTGAKAFQLVTRDLAGGIHDTQCGFKFFQRKAAQQLFSGAAISGFAFDIELLVRAHALHLPVREFPVDWSDRPGSTFRPIHDGLEAALDLWYLWKVARASQAPHAA